MPPERSRRHPPRPGRQVCVSAIVAALGWAAGTRAPAHATTFVLMDETAMEAASEVILTGTVTALEAGRDEATGAVHTYVHLQPDRAIKGTIGTQPVVLREPGGTVKNQTEWVYGAPEFTVGERVLVFLSRQADGALVTSHLAMGKFTLDFDSHGAAVAIRDFGHGALQLDPATGQLTEAQPETHRFLPLLKRLRTLARAHPRRQPNKTQASTPLRLVPAELATTPTEVQEAFTFLGTPSRWFEPDCGKSVDYLVDANGDAALGADVSRSAVDAALAVWTDVPTASLTLYAAGTTEPRTFSGCGTSRIMFNDPFNEISDPVNCGGVLAIGGFCTGDNNPCNPPRSPVVNGTWFSQIVTGKVMVANGWGACGLWTQCNLTELLTHEIGHTVGFGHSTDTDATMRGLAHFDGRCAGLRSDDIAALNSSYPQRGAPQPTNTPPAPPTTTPTPTRTALPLHLTGRVRYYGSGAAVPGASLAASGTAQRTASSDTNGDYDIGGLSPGSWTLQPSKLGDAGSGISPLDAVYVLQALVDLRTLTDQQQLACDVSGNGTISSLDAMLILQFAVGLISRFPAATACKSDWLFLPTSPGAANQSYVDPALATGSCQLGAIAYDTLTTSATQQNFTGVLLGDCTGNWQPPAPASAPARVGASTASLHLARISHRPG